MPEPAAEVEGKQREERGEGGGVSGGIKSREVSEVSDIEMNSGFTGTISVTGQPTITTRPINRTRNIFMKRAGTGGCEQQLQDARRPFL